jgi:hypothetical protein
MYIYRLYGIRRMDRKPYIRRMDLYTYTTTICMYIQYTYIIHRIAYIWPYTIRMYTVDMAYAEWNVYTV